MSQTIRTDDSILDGHPDITVARRTAVKLADRPRIYVAIPIGAKPVASRLPCPECKKTFEVNEGITVPFLIPVHFMLQHMNWVPPLNVSMTYGVKTGVRSPVARQILTMEAIRAGAEYIFYVDDDTIVPPLGLYTLYNFMEQNPQAGAVSGVYTTRETPNEPLVYKEHGAGCSWDFEMGEGATPELIFGAGAGCLLARVSAIKEWMEENPDIPIWADTKDVPSVSSADTTMWGHDIRFCRELNMAGFPVYIDGRVLCDHYDIRTGKLFRVPDTAPGFRKAQKRQQNINTASYWDQVYGQEGADSWRKYPEMFQKITDAVEENARVVELGCGVGILGSKLTAEKHVTWHGYDLSSKAVDMCKTRFLSASVKDLCYFDHVDVMDADTVVMSETLEHLDRDLGIKVLTSIHESLAHKLIITTPNACMGPDTVPEHTALFDPEYLKSMLKDAGYDDWECNIVDADNHHLICVAERV